MSQSAPALRGLQPSYPIPTSRTFTQVTLEAMVTSQETGKRLVDVLLQFLKCKVRLLLPRRSQLLGP